MDPLCNLKQSLTKRASDEVFNNELNDMKRIVNDDTAIDSRYSQTMRFILEEAETGGAGKRKRADPVGNSPKKALQLGDEGPSSRARVQRKSKGKEVIIPKELNKDEEGRGKRTRKSSQKALQLGSNSDDDVGQSSRTRIQRKSKGKEPIIPEGLNKDEEGRRHKRLDIIVKVEGASKPGSKNQGKEKENEPTGKIRKRLDIYVKVEGEKKVESEKKARNSVPKWKEREDKIAEKLEKAMQWKKRKVDEEESGKKESEKTPPPQMKDKGKGVAIEQPIFTSPFVPSWGRQESLLIEEDATRVFRDEVLTLQRQPFDLDEYSRLQEVLIAGSYLDQHQDVKGLVLSQYKREKRLAILRGFFFWLQNKDRKGAFKPWNDCICLEVDPPNVG